jgi:uncharacterized membrane protein
MFDINVGYLIFAVIFSFLFVGIAIMRIKLNKKNKS